MSARKQMLAMERKGWSVGGRPLTAGGRTLRKPHKPDGGGKRHGMKARWVCIGCPTKPGQRCGRAQEKPQEVVVND